MNYCHEYFCPQTKGHGCDIFCQEVTFFHFNLQFNLWDTAGLEQHATLTRSHYLLSQAVLIVYSVNDEESLSQAIEILKFAKIHAQGACFILITTSSRYSPLSICLDQASVWKCPTDSWYHMTLTSH